MYGPNNIYLNMTIQTIFMYFLDLAFIFDNRGSTIYNLNAYIAQIFLAGWGMMIELMSFVSMYHTHKCTHRHQCFLFAIKILQNKRTDICIKEMMNTFYICMCINEYTHTHTEAVETVSISHLFRYHCQWSFI